MQYDANTDAIDEHVRGFAGQQEELEADVERSKSRQMTVLCFLCSFDTIPQGKNAYREQKVEKRAAAQAAERQIQVLPAEVHAELSERWETVSTCGRTLRDHR